jgi:hypothetical protein
MFLSLFKMRKIVQLSLETWLSFREDGNRSCYLPADNLTGKFQKLMIRIRNRELAMLVALTKGVSTRATSYLRK